MDMSYVKMIRGSDKMNVFDFDNTIYDGETLVDFIVYYIKTDPRIWKYVPKLLWIYFKDTCHLLQVSLRGIILRLILLKKM